MQDRRVVCSMIQVTIVVCLGCVSYSLHEGLQEVRIGGLFGVEFDASTSITALRLAVDYVNKRDDVLPDVTMVYVGDLTESANYVLNDSGTFDIIRGACDVVQRGVITVIGPDSTTNVKAVAPVLSGLHIPYIAPFATDPTLSDQATDFSYQFKMSASDYYQSAAIMDLMEYFGWRRFSIIASATDYGRNGVIPLIMGASKNDWNIISVAYFSHDNLTREALKPMLAEIRNKGTRIVVLSCLARYARVVLSEASYYGMLQATWSWITTDGVTLLGGLYESGEQVPNSIEGLLGTRPLSSSGALYPQFDVMWRDKGEHISSESFAMQVFDAVLIAAYGIHDYLEDGHVLSVPPQYDCDVCSGASLKPWSSGEILAEYITKASGDGAAHYLSFTDLRYSTTTDYDVVNLRKDGWIKVGSWINRTLRLEEPVLFPGGVGVYPRDTMSSLVNITLRVVTILEAPFTMVDGDSEVGVTGYSIDLLNKLQEDLGFEYTLHIVQDGNYGGWDANTGTWNGLMEELITDKADLVVAPLTISYERQKVIELTKPFLDLGNVILMAKEMTTTSYAAFLDPFSWQLWLTLGSAFSLVGVCSTLVNWLSPNGDNGGNTSSLDGTNTTGGDDKNAFNLSSSLWFAFSQWMMQGAELSPRFLSGRLLSGAWYFTVMVISATYTANLAAFLTVQRLDTGIESLTDLASQSDIVYGTVNTTATAQFFQIQVSEPYVTMHRYMQQADTYVINSSVGLKMVQDSYGKPKDEQYALIYDSVPLEYASHTPPCNTTVIGRLFNQFGYGLGLQKNSPFLDLFDLEVLVLRQEGYLNTLYDKWVTSGQCDITLYDSSTNTEAKQTTLEQMSGVFLVLLSLVIVAFLCILCECCVAARRDCRTMNEDQHNSSSFRSALVRRCAAISSDIRHFIGSVARGICRQTTDTSGKSTGQECDHKVSAITNDDFHNKLFLPNNMTHSVKVEQVNDKAIVYDVVDNKPNYVSAWF